MRPLPTLIFSSAFVAAKGLLERQTAPPSPPAQPLACKLLSGLELQFPSLEEVKIGGDTWTTGRGTLSYRDTEITSGRIWFKLSASVKDAAEGDDGNTDSGGGDAVKSLVVSKSSSIAPEAQVMSDGKGRDPVGLIASRSYAKEEAEGK